MRKSKKEVTIDIKEEIASVISSRSTVDRLVKIIESTDTNMVVLDFNNVEFVSRSATHALITMKKRYSSWKLFNKKRVAFINMNRSFEKMLQSVVASSKYMRKEVKFNPKKVSQKVLFEKNLI